MKKTIITISLLSCFGFGGYITHKINHDIGTGVYPKSNIIDSEYNADINQIGYDTSTLPLSLLKHIIDIPENETKSITFKYDKDGYSKNVYSIKGDSFAHSYSFDDFKNNEINKETKSLFFKMSSEFLDKDGINRIYRSNTSNIMMVSYILEFEKETSVAEIFRYTSQILKSDENKSNILKEINLLSKYVDLDSKYKRVNLTFNSNTKGFVLRHLVSEHLESNLPEKTEYRLVYKK